MAANAPRNTQRTQRPNWSEDISTFLVGLDEYRPTVPEAVSQYYAQKAGCSADDPRVIKFLSLACDKYLNDIINDSKQFSQLRQKGATSGTTKAASKRKTMAAGASIQKTEIFELEDLSRALGTYYAAARFHLLFVVCELILLFICHFHCFMMCLPQNRETYMCAERLAWWAT